MPKEKKWQFELAEYIRQGEPKQKEKTEAWKTAIGLQAVDGLETSAYLLDTAKAHIEGKIDIDEAQKRIQAYYEERSEAQEEAREADLVSARIAKLLGENSFRFSLAEWLSIHGRLFEGIFNHGKVVLLPKPDLGGSSEASGEICFRHLADSSLRRGKYQSHGGVYD